MEPHSAGSLLTGHEPVWETVERGSIVVVLVSTQGQYTRPVQRLGQFGAGREPIQRAADSGV